MALSAMQACCQLEKEDVEPERWLVSDKNGEKIGYVAFSDNKISQLVWLPARYRSLSAFDFLWLIFSRVSEHCDSAPRVVGSKEFVIEVAEVGRTYLHPPTIVDVRLRCGHYSFSVQSDDQDPNTIISSESEH